MFSSVCSRVFFSSCIALSKDFIVLHLSLMRPYSWCSICRKVSWESSSLGSRDSSTSRLMLIFTIVVGSSVASGTYPVKRLWPSTVICWLTYLFPEWEVPSVWRSHCSVSSSVSVMWAFLMICPQSAKCKADHCEGRPLSGTCAVRTCVMTACITALQLSDATSHSPAVIAHTMASGIKCPFSSLRRMMGISSCCGSTSCACCCWAASASILCWALWYRPSNSACWSSRLFCFFPSVLLAEVSACPLFLKVLAEESHLYQPDLQAFSDRFPWHGMADYFSTWTSQVPKQDH